MFKKNDRYVSALTLGLTGSITAGSPFSPFSPKAPAAPATCSYRASTEVAFFTQQSHSSQVNEWQRWAMATVGGGGGGGGGQLSQGKECVGTLERNVLTEINQYHILSCNYCSFVRDRKVSEELHKKWDDVTEQNRQHGVSSHVEKEWTSTLCCAWNGAVLSLHYHCAVWLKVTR